VKPAAGASERGFALVAVLLVLSLVGIIGAEFAYSMRLEASAVRAWKDGITAAHLAEAGVEQAMREIAADAAYVAVADDGELTFYTRERIARPRLPRSGVSLGGGQFSYRVTDEEARLNLNTSPPDRVDRLLLVLGLTKAERDVIVDSLQDWMDPNEEHRANGAESEDYYLKLPIPHQSRNGPLESVAELLQIRGVTPRIFNGDGDTPALADLVTVKTRARPTSTPPACRCCVRSACPTPRSPTSARGAATAPTRRCRDASRAAAWSPPRERSGSRRKAWWTARCAPA
jgi:general secretion pathway protein K